MSNFERGVYQPPSDDVRVFDGSEDDDDAEGSRLPLLIVIALFVLAAFAGVVWLAYTQGVQRGHLDVPRIIAAQPGPVKTAPAATADNSTPFKGLKIYEQPAPPDEEADQESPPQTTAATVKAPPIRTATVAPAPVVAPPMVHKQVAPVVVPPAAVVTSTLPPVTKPVHEKPASTAATAPPAPLVHHEVTTTAAASGAFVLQIGAYKSEADANAAWSTYKAKHAALLSGYSADIKEADLGDKGTWYRLRTGSFASKDVAGALCDRLKADGGACFPAK